jgi:hypothetical protein
MLNRRNVLLTLGGLLIPGPYLKGSALASGADRGQKLSFDPALLQPPESPVDFPIERANPRIVRKKFRRQEVAFRGDAPPRSIVVDPRRWFLFYVLDRGPLRGRRRPGRFCVVRLCDRRHEAQVAKVGAAPVHG